MGDDKRLNPGVLLAILTVVVWASTYISTKVLVRNFTPLEISLVRFTIGLVLFNILAPPWRYRKTARTRRCRRRLVEWPIATAGVLGMFLYYFLENLAAGHTYASNVSIIVTSIPLWTALLGPLFDSSEKLHWKYVAAFVVVMGGMAVLIFGGNRSEGGFSPAGDLAALGASVVFALYSLVLKKADPSIPALHLTRKTLTWGWIAILAAALLSGNIPEIGEVVLPGNLPHFLFLGIVASALCFWTWGLAVRRIGAVRASQFIYLVPFVTVTLSAVFLGEQITLAKAAGLVAVVAGVVISQTEVLRSWPSSDYKSRKEAT